MISKFLKNQFQKSIFEFEIFSVTLDFPPLDPHDPDEPQQPPLEAPLFPPLDGAGVPHPVVFSVLSSSKSGGK